MAKITFKTAEALGRFHTMVEGMDEVRRDDRGDDAITGLEGLIEATGASTFPATIAIQERMARQAQQVIENLEDDGDEDHAVGDISIDHDPYPEMDTREALTVARDALAKVAASTDTASPEGHMARLALVQVEAMLAQRGCEHFDAAGDGTLTSLCDVIIFG